jgi:hypothetical protein
MKTCRRTLFALCLAAVAAAPAHAFDSKHKGFQLGVGAGVGLTIFDTQIRVGSDSLLYAFHDQGTQSGLATDFRIGFGVTDRLSIHYDNLVSWFGIEGLTVASGVTNLRVFYFMNPKVYLTAGPGIAGWSLPFESGAGGYTGGGFVVGSGWEFRPHWLVEGTVMAGRPTDKASGYETETNTSSFLVTFNYLWY